MSSFADELLADLGGGGGEEEEAAGQQTPQSNGHGPEPAADNGQSARRATAEAEDNDGWGAMDEDSDEDSDEENGADGMDENGSAQRRAAANPNAVQPTQEMGRAEVDAMDLRPESGIGSVRSVCKLLDSAVMQEALRNIFYYSSLPQPDIAGILEESPEYRLIVKANNLAVDVDNEIMIAHKYIRDHYSSRFPELETLIHNPWEFVRAVQAIGNSDDLTKARLDGILPQGTIIVISMTASTTKGRKLTADAWARVDEACKLVFELDEARRKILEYVESRMTIIAPSLSKVVGSRVATKLLGVAGGLTALTKIPACNIGLLGASKKTLTGMSTSFSGRHQGFIVQAPLVENTGEEYHRQAIRIVSAKALLAARMDAGGADRHGVYGAKLAQELEKKLEKLQEPPPAKMTKALPVPVEGGSHKKRRGGRRARKLKERNGMTELHKMQNRVRFGEVEEEAGAFDETVGMGMLGSKAESGRLRAQASTANKARMSKRNTQRIQAMQSNAGAAARLESYGQSSAPGGALIGGGGAQAGRTPGGASTMGASSGTASTLSFTPVQGIELVDPSRQSKVEAANAKWFREGMFSLAPGAQSSSSSSSKGAMPSSNMDPPSSLPVPNKRAKAGE